VKQARAGSLNDFETISTHISGAIDSELSLPFVIFKNRNKSYWDDQFLLFLKAAAAAHTQENVFFFTRDAVAVKVESGRRREREI
jgi:hypothetical protein